MGCSGALPSGESIQRVGIVMLEMAKVAKVEGGSEHGNGLLCAVGDR